MDNSFNLCNEKEINNLKELFKNMEQNDEILFCSTKSWDDEENMDAIVFVVKKIELKNATRGQKSSKNNPVFMWSLVGNEGICFYHIWTYDGNSLEKEYDNLMDEFVNNMSFYGCENLYTEY